MNDRPPMSEARLRAWLEDGPTSGPDDGLSNALARTRSTRQRPGWLAGIRGDPMETTWRARPVAPTRVAVALLALLIVLAIALAGAVVGSRLGLIPGPDRGLNVVGPAIPQGGEAVLAYANWSGGRPNGDIYTVRADGTDPRFITQGFDPSWSPDGSMIAFYSDAGAAGWDLKIADADGIRTLHAGIGCTQMEMAPQWSPDSRFVLYPVSRGAPAACPPGTENNQHDDMVIPADGSQPGHALLADPTTRAYSVGWSPDGRALAVEIGYPPDGISDRGVAILDVIDPDAPWQLDSRRLTPKGSGNGWAWPRWSPDGTLIATTTFAEGSDIWDAVVMAPDGSGRAALWSGTEDDALPMWSRDGTAISLLVKDGPGGYGPQDAYSGYILDATHGAGGRMSSTRLDAPPLFGGSYGLPFSPDGSRVAGYAPTPASSTRSPWDLYVIPVDGGGELLTLDATALPNAVIPSTVSWQPLVNERSPLAWAQPAPAPGSPAPGSPAP